MRAVVERERAQVKREQKGKEANSRGSRAGGEPAPDDADDLDWIFDWDEERREVDIEERLERYCQVDEKLVDRPPRYCARASREPAMLGIRNGRQPQLDNTVSVLRLRFGGARGRLGGHHRLMLRRDGGLVVRASRGTG